MDMTGHRGRSRNIVLRILFAAIIGGLLDMLTVTAGGRAGIVEMVLPILAAAAVTATGEMVLGIFRVAGTAAWLPAAFVTGAATISMAMLPLVFFAGLSAQSAFLLCAGFSALLFAGLRKRIDPAPELQLADIGISACQAALIGFYTHGIATALPVLLQSDILPAWSDYFVHGTFIASFGDPLAIGRGDIMLAGVPRFFYHYGPFMLPAALLPLTQLSGLGLALAVLLPLGLLIGIFGLYALAVELAGVGPGLCAVLAVACLPDASRYMMQNGFYGFHWLLYTAPGSGCAIGVGAMAFSCVVQWLRERARRPLVLGCVLTAVLIMLRVHMFMLVAPALAGTIFVAVLRPRWRKPATALTIVAILLPSLMLMSAAAEDGLSRFARPFPYITAALNNGPALYAHVFTYLTQHAGRAAAIAAGLAMMFLAAVGLWAFVLPAIAFLGARRGTFRIEDIFPILLCLTFIILTLWAPEAQNGDLSEYKQRHFVFLYAIVVLWSVSRIVQNVPAWPGLVRQDRNSAALIFFAAVTATILAFRDYDPGRPSLSWAKTFYANPVAPGLAEASGFIRTHSGPGDTLAVGGPLYNGPGYEPAVQIVSMADVPAYVSRVELATTMRPALGPLVHRRVLTVAKIDEDPSSSDAALELMRIAKLRWYVRIAPDLPKWDPDGAHAAYRSGSVVVYDASPASGAQLGSLRFTLATAAQD